MFKLISDIFTILSGILCVLLAIVQIIVGIQNKQLDAILLMLLIGFGGLCLIGTGVKEIEKGKEE